MMVVEEARGDDEEQQKRRSKSRRRRRRKKESAAPELETNLNVGRRWFSMYDVFRCKQLQIQLSTTTIPRNNDPDHKPLISTKAHQAPRKSFTDKKHVSGLVNDHIVNSESQKKLIPTVLGSDSELLDQEEKQKRIKKNAELLRRMEMVRRLQSDEPELQQVAASEVRAAARRDGEARTTLALMGAIPPLVSMLDSPSSSVSSAALAALLNLAVRNDPNKAAIVAAGAVPKIIKLIRHQAATAALLSLSALDSNKPTIAACSGALPAIVAATHGEISQSRRDAMGALFNLSLCAANAPLMCAAGAVPAVLRAVYDPELTPRAVAAAANLASTQAGRRALAREEEAGLVFLDVLSWTRCGGGGAHVSGQVECAAYVVMVLAQCSGAQRRAMARAGCSSLLLELVLVGSPEVQERASRALQFLDEESSGTSSSYCCSLLIDEVVGGGDENCSEQQRREAMEQEIYSEERRAVNRLVQQSLRLNMERITKRACIPFANQTS